MGIRHGSGVIQRALRPRAGVSTGRLPGVDRNGLRLFKGNRAFLGVDISEQLAQLILVEPLRPAVV